ncbi:hypothetical protein VA596_41710 [Amycolatopsis sp., V23-08]|uniref:Uncharacterized protein n=1 Tax=Amycolatopsis heterodermiae TaxID=3110235 RepID=A0ABU5RK50_9PSEU|nr:hypothetical protein [Amycolatopsis sp., V23-08]MEA5366104.1 hypothetical protein [Amycolatopsis sp., V23-08]
MPKQSGLGWTALGVDDALGTLRDIRNDVHEFDFSTPRAVQDTTGVDKSAMERLLLLSDFQINLSGTFNPTANASHDVLSSVSSTDVVRTVSLGIASKTLANECVFSDYALTRGSGGEFTWKTTGSLANGALPTWA